MGEPLPPMSPVLTTFRYAPYPQRCALLPHCQTAAFSDFSLDWFSGYQQEEDSFVSAMHLPQIRLLGIIGSYGTPHMPMQLTEIQDNCKPILFNVGRYHGIGTAGVEPAHLSNSRIDRFRVDSAINLRSDYFDFDLFFETTLAYEYNSTSITSTAMPTIPYFQTSVVAIHISIDLWTL